MPSYYKDGARYAVDPERSEARFHLTAVGVPVLHGTLPVTQGEIVVDETNGIRTANFQLDALRLVLETPLGQADTLGLFGTSTHPVIEFETQWAREKGPDSHELDGLLRLHGQQHVFSLRADRGSWEQVHDESQWYRGLVRGALDRKAWEVRSDSLADAALLLLGHEVQFEVTLVAGPRLQAVVESTGAEASAERSATEQAATERWAAEG